MESIYEIGNARAYNSSIHKNSKPNIKTNFMTDNIKDINNWQLPTKGLLRYIVGANACYEILILNINYTELKNKYNIFKKNIMTDTEAIYNPNAHKYISCNLYISGEWINDKSRALLYNREALNTNTTLDIALLAAYNEYTKDIIE